MTAEPLPCRILGATALTAHAAPRGELGGRGYPTCCIAVRASVCAIGRCMPTVGTQCRTHEGSPELSALRTRRRSPGRGRCRPALDAGGVAGVRPGGGCSRRKPDQIVLTGHLVVTADETVDSAVIFNGPALVEGTVRDTLVVLNGDAEVTGTVRAGRGRAQRRPRGPVRRRGRGRPRHAIHAHGRGRCDGPRRAEERRDRIQRSTRSGSGDASCGGSATRSPS